MSGRIRLAVLAGGRSSEHEISLASAASVAAALDPARYDVRTIEIGRDGRWALPPGETRAALSATSAYTTHRSFRGVAALSCALFSAFGG